MPIFVCHVTTKSSTNGLTSHWCQGRAQVKWISSRQNQLKPCLMCSEIWLRVLVRLGHVFGVKRSDWVMSPDSGWQVRAGVGREIGLSFRGSTTMATLLSAINGLIFARVFEMGMLCGWHALHRQDPPISVSCSSDAPIRTKNLKQLGVDSHVSDVNIFRYFIGPQIVILGIQLKSPLQVPHSVR